MADILNPQENLNPSVGLKSIFTKLIEIIKTLNTAVSNISTLQLQTGTYKKYVALVTQSTISTTSGLLVVGKTYLIDTLEVGDDFSNVGYVSDGTFFIATGTTPTNWTNSTVVVNVTNSAPESIVLENTLGGTPTWSYEDVGEYELTLASIFTIGKTYIYIQQPDSNSGKLMPYQNDSSSITVYGYDSTTTQADNGMSNSNAVTSLEIRVYN